MFLILQFALECSSERSWATLYLISLIVECAINFFYFTTEFSGFDVALLSTFKTILQTKNTPYCTRFRSNLVYVGREKI